MVTADQSDSKITLLGISDTALYLCSKWVSETKYTNEGETEFAAAQGILQSSPGASTLIFISLGPGLKLHLDVGECKHSEWLRGHPADYFCEALTFFCSENGSLSGLLNMSTEAKNDLWGTLDVDCYSLWAVWALECNYGPLSLWREWTDGSDSAELSLDQQMHWDFSVLEESQKSDLSAVAHRHIGCCIHLDSGFAVVEDAILDTLQCLGTELAVEERILSGVLDKTTFALELDNFHIVSGNGTCLTAADLLDSSHPFWSIQLSYEDLLVVHCHHREGEGDADGEREAFRDGDDDKDDAEVDLAGELGEEGSSNARSL